MNFNFNKKRFHLFYYYYPEKNNMDEFLNNNLPSYLSLSYFCILREKEFYKNIPNSQTLSNRSYLTQYLLTIT